MSARWKKEAHSDYVEYIDGHNYKCPTVTWVESCAGFSFAENNCMFAWWKNHNWYPCPPEITTLDDAKAYALVMYKMD